MMDLLAWLLVGHMAGDFIFQTKWMADGKARRFAPLFVHAVVYTLCVWAVSLAAGGISPLAAALVFAAHLFIDRRDFVRWWCKYITRSDGCLWLTVVTDQSFHIMILAAAVLLTKYI
jgi:hypothetical protein